MHLKQQELEESLAHHTGLTGPLAVCVTLGKSLNHCESLLSVFWLRSSRQMQAQTKGAAVREEKRR